MDEHIERKIDQVVEDEVRTGVKVLTLDPTLVHTLDQARLEEPTLPHINALRYLKLTPKKRSLINKAMIRTYHADLQDRALLSMAQVRKLCVERGEWSADEERRLEDLTAEVALLSTEAFKDGIEDDAAWVARKGELARDYREALDSLDDDGKPRLAEHDRLEAIARFGRWVAWTPDRQAEYDGQYAASQGRPAYNVDNDTQWLYDHLPRMELIDVLVELEDVRDRVYSYLQLLRKRKDLMALRDRQAKMYAETVEQRRDQVEEYARLFYCCERGTLDPKGRFQSAGPLVDKLEDVWLLPEPVLGFLLIDVYFFLNGMPDEARKVLEQMGFLPAPPSDGSPEPSGGSPAEPTSSPDSPPSGPTPSDSTEPPTPTS